MNMELIGREVYLLTLYEKIQHGSHFRHFCMVLQMATLISAENAQLSSLHFLLDDIIAGIEIPLPFLYS